MDEEQLKNSVEILCENLQNDEALYIAWQANIAMAFKDEYARQIKMSKALDIHSISNNAAKNFLDLLTRKSDGDA